MIALFLFMRLVLLIVIVSMFIGSFYGDNDAVFLAVSRHDYVYGAKKIPSSLSKGRDKSIVYQYFMILFLSLIRLFCQKEGIKVLSINIL